VQLRDGSYFEGDGSSLDQYPYLGSDVLAVGDGTVVFTRDDMPNEIPNLPPSHVKKPIDFAGNQVVSGSGRSATPSTPISSRAPSRSRSASA
jgi:hypothetical protein